MPRIGATHATVQHLRAAFGDRPFSTAAARDVGVSYERLRAAVTAGGLVRVRRGHLLVVEDGDSPPTLVNRARAVLERLPPNAAVSHASAAQLHGMWRPDSRPEPRLFVTVPGQGDRRGFGVVVRTASMHPVDVEVLDGVRVTSPGRTAVDLARGQSLPAALVPLDSATRLLIARSQGSAPHDLPALRRACGRDDVVRAAADSITDAYRRQFGWPGTAAVRRLLPGINPRSESPLESRSRGAFLLAELPEPEVGVPIRGASGARYYVDFLWRRERVVGEADGWAKYGSGDRVREVLAAERARQADIEATGLRVLRWTSDTSLDTLVALVRRALAGRGARP